MTYILFSISGASYLAGMTLFNQITKKNTRSESIVLHLAGLMCLMIVATGTGTAGLTVNWINRLTHVVERQNERLSETREEKIFPEQRNSHKSLPRYLDVLHEKSSQEFGDEFVTLFQEDLRYVIVKKIDFIKFGKSKGLNKLAKSDCAQVFKATSNGQVNFPPIDIRYIDTGNAHTKRFQCDQIALLERDRHIKPVQ